MIFTVLEWLSRIDEILPFSGLKRRKLSVSTHLSKPTYHA